MLVLCSLIEYVIIQNCINCGSTCLRHVPCLIFSVFFSFFFTDARSSYVGRLAFFWRCRTIFLFVLICLLSHGSQTPMQSRKWRPKVWCCCTVFRQNIEKIAVKIEENAPIVRVVACRTVGDSCAPKWRPTCIVSEVSEQFLIKTGFKSEVFLSVIVVLVCLSTIHLL